MAGDAAAGFFWSPYGTNPELLKYEVPEYTRTVHATLGSEHETTTNAPDARRCFNCGSTEHILSDCSERRNRELIALTRQLYDFFKGSSAGPTRRIHEVEQWKKQRIEWLETFEPGQIRGAELRDALGVPDGDVGEYVPWLRNIADFGYPRGWAAEEDPRIRVWSRIMQQDSSDDDSDDDVEFSIYGDTHEALFLPSRTTAETRTNDEDSESSEDPSSSAEEGEIADSPKRATFRRWANYPETYFSNSRLFVYTPPPIQPELDPLDTLMVIYDSSVHGHWTDFAQFAMPFLQPPAPPGAPPPLPPPPPSSSPPPLPPGAVPPPTPSESLSPSARPPHSPSKSPLLLPPHPLSNLHSNDLDDGSDMELSDSD